jgi:hypothetical protein
MIESMFEFRIFSFSTMLKKIKNKNCGEKTCIFNVDSIVQYIE